MRTILNGILTGLFSLLFIYAGFVKAVNTGSFYHELRNYHLLPVIGAWLFAHFLPWLEIVSGVGLLITPIRNAASTIITCLLILFMAAISSAWWRGLHIECGCFGEGDRTSSYAWLLFRDGILLAFSIYSLCTTWALSSGKPKESPDSVSHG